MTPPKAFATFKALALSAAIFCAAATPSAANPDVWITVKYVLRFNDTAMTGAAIEWRFDPYMSDRAITEFDADGDGRFSADETKRLRVEAFEPLAEQNYYFQLRSQDQTQPVRVDAFGARIEDNHLVFSFTVEPEVPLDYRAHAVSLTHYDESIYFDFSFAEENFLLVDGPFDPSCRFRVESGDGLFDRYRKTVTLRCGA